MLHFDGTISLLNKSSTKTLLSMKKKNNSCQFHSLNTGVFSILNISEGFKKLLIYKFFILKMDLIKGAVMKIEHAVIKCRLSFFREFFSGWVVSAHHPSKWKEETRKDLREGEQSSQGRAFFSLVETLIFPLVGRPWTTTPKRVGRDSQFKAMKSCLNGQRKTLIIACITSFADCP